MWATAGPEFFLEDFPRVEQENSEKGFLGRVAVLTAGTIMSSKCVCVYLFQGHGVTFLRKKVVFRVAVKI